MKPLPVTVLSGFLGAGKTTLLNHLLRHDHGHRIAVIVNDMSMVNMDARLVQTGQRALLRTPERLVEMTNGCVCCTLREDLLKVVEELARMDRFDYLLIEATGISEPLPVAETFTFADSTGAHLIESARLDTLVTVVDAANLFGNVLSLESLKDRKLEASEEDERHLSELIVDQIEFANVIVLNKVDMISDVERGMLEEIIRQLNPQAEVIPARRGHVPPERILGTGKFTFEWAARAPRWLGVPRGQEVPETDLFRVGSFVYRAARPFHPWRLWHFVQGRTWAGVLRSKGFIWLATRPETAVLWSQVGRIFNLEPAGQWWAAVPEEERPAVLPDPWHPDYGDRRQEIVFIGQNLDELGLSMALDRCLLSDEEMALGAEEWHWLEDPFPAWEGQEPVQHRDHQMALAID